MYVQVNNSIPVTISLLASTTIASFKMYISNLAISINSSRGIKLLIIHNTELFQPCNKVVRRFRSLVTTLQPYHKDVNNFVISVWVAKSMASLTICKRSCMVTLAMGGKYTTAYSPIKTTLRNLVIT